LVRTAGTAADRITSRETPAQHARTNFRHTVGVVETGVWDLAVQERELVAEDEDLGVFGTIASAPQHEQVDD